MGKIKTILLVIFSSILLISCKREGGIDTSKIEVNKEVHEIKKEEKLIAPKIELIDVNGKKKTLEDFKGHTVLINFFKTWDVNCAKEMPIVMEVGDKYKNKNVEVVFINVGEKLEEVKEFIKEHPVTSHNILLDSNLEVKKSYTVEKIPTTYVIDKNGYIFARLSNATTKEELENIIKGVL